MLDMEDKNLQRLREQTLIEAPILGERLLSIRKPQTARRLTLSIVPIAACLLVFAAIIQTQTHPQPQNKIFDSSRYMIQKPGESMIMGPAIEAGVTFSRGPNLSNIGSNETVWKIEPVIEFQNAKEELAKTLDYKYPIDELSNGIVNPGLKSASLRVSTSTGQWNYENLTHGLSVDGTCVDTKTPGACTIENKHLGESFYKEKAAAIFSAGGFKGSISNIILDYDKRGRYGANALMLINGKASPIRWQASWFEDGTLEDARGFLSDINDVGSYVTVSPAAAVSRAADYSEWTSEDGNRLFVNAPFVNAPRAVVTKAELVLGFHGGFLVPSYRLSGESGIWYRQVNALAK